MPTWLARVKCELLSRMSSRTNHRDRPRQARQPVFPSDLATIRWTAPGAQPRSKTEEPESLAAMEASVR